MKLNLRLSIVAVAIAAAANAATMAVGTSADAPHVYAIRGAKIVPVSGPAIASGTVVIRNGIIEAVGAGVTAPAEAQVIDGSGLTVYPGLIDMAQRDRREPAGQPAAAGDGADDRGSRALET